MTADGGLITGAGEAYDSGRGTLKPENTKTLNPKFPPSACQLLPPFSGQATPEAVLCTTQY